MRLYFLSKELKSEIDKRIKMVQDRFGSVITFQEYVVIPDYAERIILRFSLSEPYKYNMEALDKIETEIREIIGYDFWANLMGDVYKQYNGEISSISDVFKYAHLYLSPKPDIRKAFYYEEIKSDVKYT